MKKAHVEISLHGERVAELGDWIKESSEVKELSEEPEEEFVSSESSESGFERHKT